MNLLLVLKNKLKHKNIQLWIIVIFTVLSYINIFGNGFVWDDYDLIVNWPEIRSWRNIPTFLTEATNPNYPDTYRPIRYIFSIFMYQLSGTNPLGYHIATLVLHITVTILIFLILGYLAKNTYIPFLTALFFGIHPVHTEAITWISSGMDMIGIVLLFGSILSALQTPQHGAKNSSFHSCVQRSHTFHWSLP